MGLRITTSDRGEIIIHFPDGSVDYTGLIPSDNERQIFEMFLQTTAGRSYIMEKHECATNDGLTKLLRQQPARATIEQLFERLNTIGFEGVISVLMLDLDHFGVVNKLHGNPGGDEVLKWFANILKKCVRLGDIVARWGGEEFLIVAPASKPHEEHQKRERDKPYSETAQSTGTTIPSIEQLFGNGKLIGERIRGMMQRNPCVLPSGQLVHQTVTVGVANVYVKQESDVQGLFEELLHLSNQAMYRGKRTDRRDCVHVAQMTYGKPKAL